MPSAPSTPPTPLLTDPRSRRLIVAAVCLSSAVMTLDTTVVNVALPKIGADFHSTLSGLQWIVNGYTLAFAALLLSAGALSDRWGRRGLFLLGMAIFTGASVACALASSQDLLMAFRIIQGAGASLVMGTGLALISSVYSPEEDTAKQSAIGLFTALGGASAALGPLVGGVLVDAAGWRSIFVLNIVLGLLTLVLIAPAHTPVSDTSQPGHRVDLVGAALAIGMLFALNYGLLTGSQYTWSRSDVIAALVATPVLLLVFVIAEHRLGAKAMFDLRLFRIPTFTGAIVLSFASRATTFGMFPLVILWLTGILGHTPTQVGLIMLVLSAGMLLVAPASGLLTKLVPVRLLMCLGMVISGVGLFFSAHLLTPNSSWTAYLPALVLLGVGSGLVMPQMMGLAVSVVPSERAGMASGASNAFFPLGTAVGVAVNGAIMSAVVSSRVGDSRAAHAVEAGRVKDLAAVSPKLAEIGKDAFITGLSHVFVVAAVASIIGGFISLVLVRAEDLPPKQRASHAPGEGATVDAS